MSDLSKTDFGKPIHKIDISEWRGNYPSSTTTIKTIFICFLLFLMIYVILWLFGNCNKKHE